MLLWEQHSVVQKLYVQLVVGYIACVAVWCSNTKPLISVLTQVLDVTDIGAEKDLAYFSDVSMSHLTSKFSHRAAAHRLSLSLDR
jgi:hypothetical protein